MEAKGSAFKRTGAEVMKPLAAPVIGGMERRKGMAREADTR